MAPINDYLPREVLVKIFFYYMKSEGPLKFLRNVSPVCKLWKDLIPSYPLWKEVSWKSLKWNSDYLLEIVKRGFLASTRTLNLSCTSITEWESEVIGSIYPRLKLEDFLQLIDCCHNLKVLYVCQINFMTETTLQFIARKCPLQERFIVDSMTYEYDPKYKHSKMVLIDDGNKMIEKSYFDIIRRKRCSDLSSRFGHDGRIISKIADCCPFLEELHFCDVRVDGIQVNHLFPIAKVQKGCPKLRVLEISCCNLDWSNDEELEGFKDIREFTASFCDFRDQDVGKIFKISTKLEELRLHHFHRLIFSHIPEIPTENVKLLQICSAPYEKVLGHLLEKAVKKWRLTLKKLMIHSGNRDLTNILKNLVVESRDGRNCLAQNSTIEEISVIGYLNVASMKSLIRNSPKLRSFYIRGLSNGDFSFIDLKTREALEKYLKS